MVIELVNEVFGITYWRQNLPNCRPAFEVYKCVGRVRETGRYVFQATGKGRGVAVIYRAAVDLGRNGFEPFLYNRDQLDKYNNAGLAKLAEANG